MGFQPGQSGNPAGRPKRIDPRSQELEAFCKANRDNIRKVGEIALQKAIKKQEPWAIKLCMEYFYPRPGSFVAISKEESKEVNLNFINALPYEDQQTFLRLWMKSKKGISSFPVINQEPEKSAISQSTVNNVKSSKSIVISTDAQKSD